MFAGLDLGAISFVSRVCGALFVSAAATPLPARTRGARAGRGLRDGGRHDGEADRYLGWITICRMQCLRRAARCVALAVLSDCAGFDALRSSPGWNQWFPCGWA